jgi:molybdenum cofactor cytidylyltransferase
MISTVVLAARSSWQAAEKQPSAPFRNQPTLQSILENVLASVVDEVICVTDDLEAARRDIKLVDSRLVWHFNGARRGRSSSVIAGLWASDPESDGIMLVAAEVSPFRRELIDLLIGRFESSPAWIVAPKTGDGAPNPIVFRRELYPELLKLTGDDWGVSLIAKHAEKAAVVELEEELKSFKVDQRRTRMRFKESV